MTADAAPRPTLGDRRPRLSGAARRRVALFIRVFALGALAAWSLATPGFLSPLSIISLLNAVSFIGCVAVGMTFITLTGNIMSLCLGVTLSAAALVFLSSLALGIIGALAVALLFGIAVTAAQGALVGYFRANPILVSIAALALITGISELVTGGQRIYPAAAGFELFRGRLGGLPVPALIFFAAVAIGEIVLQGTRFGRAMRMVGSNWRAAELVGIRTERVVAGAYALAGAFAGLSGVLLAARYGSGDMELGAGYDYSAIAAVLVGGTAIQGGQGSVLRTMIGVTVIAAVQVVLLLRGFDEQLQYLVTGLIVLGVIMLHTIGERE
ncbi:MAG TPA: ABC transporter permease [Stellaceae bacterium]|nr:ABC transporter permease [Stellaceae bacterium]